MCIVREAMSLAKWIVVFQLVRISSCEPSAFDTDDDLRLTTAEQYTQVHASSRRNAKPSIQVPRQAATYRTQDQSYML